MKKTLLVVTITILALAALGAGVAFAQGGYPPVNSFGYGGGMMTGRGRGAMMGGQGGYGPMHDYVEETLADRLGLTEAQVEYELASGVTMGQLALNHGIAETDLQAFMLDIHKTAFATAVADGIISQDQADAMLAHMSERNFGDGDCPMDNGEAGDGYGRGGMMGGRWGATR